MKMRWLILSLMMGAPLSGEARVLGTHIYNRHKAENRYYEQDAMEGGSVEPFRFPQKKLPEIDEDAAYDERAAQLRQWLNQRAAQRNPAHAENRSEGLSGNLVAMPYVGHGHHQAQGQQHPRHHAKAHPPAASEKTIASHSGEAKHGQKPVAGHASTPQAPGKSHDKTKRKSSKTVKNSG